MNVTVNPAVNQPPTANAGPDITITLPVNTATLSGSGTDPDGIISGYMWTKIAGPLPYTMSIPNAATVRATELVAGVYAFQLTVTDNSGATASDTVYVTVNKKAQTDIVEELKVYPNPVKDIITVEIKSPVANEAVSLVVLNIRGIPMYQQNNIVLIGNSTTMTIDMSSYKTGVYFIRVNYGRYYMIKKVIKG